MVSRWLEKILSRITKPDFQFRPVKVEKVKIKVISCMNFNATVIELFRKIRG